MKYVFRKCEDTDIHFIYELKEKCFKWYIEKIYGLEREHTDLY